MAGGQTVSQIFQQKGLWQWWLQNGGQGTNPYNGISEKGIDYSNAWGTPIGVPVGGKIVRIAHNNNSIGDVVELQAADGSVWLYQHINASVRVGQTLGVGGIIGTENGLPVDQYSTGPHIEVRYAKPGTWNPNVDSWLEPWINPYPIFSNIGKTVAGNVQSGVSSAASALAALLGLTPPSSSSSSGDAAASALLGLNVTGDIQAQLVGSNITGPTGVTIGSLPPIGLAPNADVTQALIAIDTALALINPFIVQGAQVDILGVLGQGLSFTDPISWLEGFGINLVEDFGALVWRLLLIVAGIFLVYKFVSNFVDIGKMVGQAEQAAMQAAPLLLA